jgi:beta-galactosidase
VTTKVFWNLHVPELGHFGITGQNDLAAFLKIAQGEGLFGFLINPPIALNYF